MTELKLRAGDMDRRIELLSRSTTRNGFGEAVESFTLAATVWAQVIRKEGEETERSNDVQLQARETAIFRIRWRAGMTRDMRIRWDGADWDIQSIIEIGRKAGLELQAIASRP